ASRAVRTVRQPEGWDTQALNGDRRPHVRAGRKPGLLFEGQLAYEVLDLVPALLDFHVHSPFWLVRPANRYPAGLSAVCWAPPRDGARHQDGVLADPQEKRRLALAQKVSACEIEARHDGAGAVGSQWKADVVEG